MRQTHDKQAHNGANYNETPGKPSSSASTASSVVEKHGLCDVCRRNYSDGKRHFYSRSHAKNVDTLLQKQVTKIAKLSVFRKDIKLLKDPTQQPEIWCIFCEKDLKAKYNFKEDFHVACIHIFEHLSTTQHKKNMHTFFWKHRVSQDLKHHFFIEEEDMEKVRGRSEWEGLAGLSLFRKSAAKALEKAKRKEETERLTRTSQDEPQPAPVPSQSSSLKEREIEPPPEKVHKTIISPAGIYQNPTGWHGTTRVWGGGIVKYQKPGIWIPWPIDVDDESQDFATSHMGNWAINKKQRHGDRSEIIKGKEVVVTENSNTEVDGGNAFDIPLGQPQRKRTIQAYAQDLTCIAPLPLAENEGNVHTGAVPPWLQDTQPAKEWESTGSSKQIGPSLELFLEAKQKERKAKLNPARIVADFDRSQPVGKNWMPSFGRVWNAGSRYTTKLEYLSEVSGSGEDAG